MPSKALLGLVALSVLIAGTTATAVITTYQLTQKTEHLVEEHAHEFRLTERLRSQLEHLGAIRRAYLITQRSRYLAEYERRLAALQDTFSELRALTGDSTALRLLGDVEESAREHQRAWADLQEEAAQPGADVEALFSVRLDPTRDRLNAALEMLAEDKKARFLRATEDTRRAAASTLTILIGSGALALGLAVWLVVTLRRIVAREHRQHRLFETAINTMPVGVLVIDREGQILMSNDGAKEILAGTGGGDAEFPATRALRGEIVPSREIRVGRRSIMVAGAPVRDHKGRVDSAVVTALDVTDVRAAELKFRRIFESGVVAIAIGDDAGRVSVANDAFLQLIGYDRGELVDGRIAWPGQATRAVSEASVPGREARPGASANGHAKPYEQELVHRDGRRIPVLIATERIDDQIVGILVDVSERKALERRRDQLMEELRRSVETSNLFVGVLAHDLRNPLNAILMGSQALARSAPNDAQKRVIERIGRSGDRMYRMIEQLLDFSQIRLGGALPMKPSECDLNAVCREVIEEIQGGFEGTQVGLQVKGDPTGTWDPARLEQALSNLLSNAVHHGVDGRADVSIDGSEPHRVRILVHNLGVIPPDLLPAVFDPLQRGSSTARGLGLGLFITKTIAHQHGGEVWVTSNRDAGTTFTLELPRQGEHARRDTPQRGVSQLT